MKIENTVAIITGANRDIGRAFTRELLARGVSKAFAPILKANGGGALLNVLSVAS